MKSHFRKTEYYTSHNANTPVELDSEKFPDFKGETEEEFLQYIFDDFGDGWRSGFVYGGSEAMEVRFRRCRSFNSHSIRLAFSIA